MNEVFEPKNNREVWRWFLLDPLLMNAFISSLKLKKQLLVLLKIWLFSNLTVILIFIGFDIPNVLSHFFKRSFIEVWPDTQNFVSRFFLLLDYFKYLCLLAIIFIIALVINKLLEQHSRLKSTSIVHLANYFSLIIIFNTTVRNDSSLILSLYLLMIYYPKICINPYKKQNKFIHFIIITFGSLVLETFFFRFSGLILFLLFLLAFYRLPIYIYYTIRCFFSQTFQENVILYDSLIRLKIFPLERKLLRQAKANPKETKKFINFLSNRRLLQKNLTSKLTHIATAARWQQNLLNENLLELIAPIREDAKNYQPSQDWNEQLNQVQKTLTEYKTQNNISFKVDVFERFMDELEIFRQANFVSPSRWNHFYFEAVDLWQQAAERELQDLKTQLENIEGIARNVYRGGEVLNPQYDAQVFMGREDVKKELQVKILSAQQMPLFFIQGQRRVGKTSLLRFLPAIVRSDRFRFVYYNLEALMSIREWFQDIKANFDSAFDAPAEEEQDFQIPEEITPDQWLSIWKQLADYMKAKAEKQNRKIVLAFDEYEKLQQYFEAYPKEAADLLGAMRSFSQHQNQVVFLFVGTAFFSELENPTWSNYFTQVVRIKVNYLSREDTLKLIQVVELNYSEEFLEEIWQLTQGHPALLQKICYKLVSIANLQRRNTLTMTDLDTVLEEEIFQPANGVIEVFWKQFCSYPPQMKETVLQIREGKTPAHRPSLQRLLDHDFIRKNENGTYRLRVPLFDQWLERYGFLSEE